MREEGMALLMNGRSNQIGSAVIFPQQSGVLEDPWITDCAAGDPHAIDARFLKHFHRILGGKNIATAQDSFIGIALLYFTQKLPAALTGVFLLDGSRMNASGAAAVFEDKFQQLPEHVF